MKNQKIVFSFDDRSYEPMDKLIKQGRAGKSTNPDDYHEIVVKNPETGEERVLVLEKRHALAGNVRQEIYARDRGICFYCGRQTYQSVPVEHERRVNIDSTAQ